MSSMSLDDIIFWVAITVFGAGLYLVPEHQILGVVFVSVGVVGLAYSMRVHFLPKIIGSYREAATTYPRGAPIAAVIAGIVVVLVLALGVVWFLRPMSSLVIEAENDRMNFIPQSGQPAPPKVTWFARIKVSNVGEKSIGNVAVVATKIGDRDCHYQLPLASADTLLAFPTPSLVAVSASLNVGDDQYFEALVECNGVVCPSGALMVPVVESGRRAFATFVENGAVMTPKSLTVRASGDGVSAVTKIFTVSRGSKGELLLR